VSGYFDPLLAWHAARIGDLRQGAPALAVVVREPADPILPARARAELVASLAAVDLVLIAPGGAALPVSVALEEGDLEQRAAFISHVRERQS
jgi:hypothetical protein